MRFTQKVANVARFVWDGTKAASQGQDFDKAPGFEAFMTMMGGKKLSGEIAWDDYAAQRKEYRGTTYAAIQKIGPAVAAAPLHLFMPEGKGDIRAEKRIAVEGEIKEFLSKQPFCKSIMTMSGSENLEEITDHAALDVFKRANGSMTRHQLMYSVMMNMVLYGNNYWEPVFNNAGAFPAMIRVLPTDRMKPIEDKETGMVTGYKFKQSRTRTKKYDVEEIVHFFYPNPHSISEGFSPVSAASQRISAEVNTSTFQNSTLENMGVPAAMVKVLRRMDDDKWAEFKQSFADLYIGVAKSGKVGFTQGEWEIEKLGQTLQEMGYIEGAKMLREFIANCMGVPISKLTMESSNRAVAEAGNTEFLRDRILPDLVMIAEELTESLIPMFPSLADTGAFYMFDNPVPEDMRLKIMKRRVDRLTNTTTPNDERADDGRPPHPSPEADQLGPVRAPIEQSESMAVNAIDRAVDKAIDDIKNGEG